MTNPKNNIVILLSKPVSWFRMINIIIVIFGIIYLVDIIYKEIEEDFKNQKKQYDKKIKSVSELIENKYGQFSDFIENDKIKTHLNIIVNQIPMLVGFTLHDYQICLKNKNYELNFELYMAVAHNEFDINAIINKNYSIDKKIFNKITALINEYEMRVYDKQQKIEESTSEIIELLELNGLSSNPLYKRIELILLSKYKQMIDPGTIIIDNFDDQKRTGIIGPIVLKEEYFYNYNKDKESKLGRAYMSFNMDFNGQKKIATLILNIDDYSMEYIKEEIEKAFQMLKYYNYDII
jgi:hypothetical protein